MTDYLLDQLQTAPKQKTLVGIFCASCEVNFLDENEHKIHYKSDFHQFNLKRKMLQLRPINEPAFEKSLKEILEKSKNQNKKNLEDEKKNCQVCWKEFKSRQTFIEHLKSKRHLENEKAPKQKPESKEILETTKTNLHVCLFCNKLSDSFDEFVNQKSRTYEQRPQFLYLRTRTRDRQTRNNQGISRKSILRIHLCVLQLCKKERIR